MFESARMQGVKVARSAVPAPAKRAARRLFLRDHPLAQVSRRMVAYDRRLLVNEQLVLAEQESEIGLSMGYPSWGLLYYSLLCALPPSGAVTVIETGTNLGLSTIVLAQALHDAGRAGTVHTVDLDPDRIKLAEEKVSQAGLTDLVRFHQGDSIRFLTDFCRGRPPVHFAFLDACHDYLAIIQEFMAVRRSVTAAGGLVYFDNTSAGGVAKALRRIRRRYRGDLVMFPACSWHPPGNAIWQPRSTQSRRWSA